MMYDNTKFPEVMHGVGGLISRAEANYLNQVADRLGTGLYIDLGTYRGRSAACIADGIRRNNLPLTQVLTIDAFDNRALSSRFRDDLGLEDVEETLKQRELASYVLVYKGETGIVPGWIDRVRFAFIDADHSYEGCLADWRAWRHHIDGEVAFHDSHLDGPARVLAEEMKHWEQVDRVDSITVWRRV
jgi:predicted O-methyltransferase YrrM